ncbi:unnamed protein product [Meganyctiphanes norvegica]|uniref:Kinase n=1 Tax=Meganyctiphanes norvegica TaxID=48144 RepID=A0AAV2R580_MEGNR
MDTQVIPHENQLGGHRRKECSSLLRGEFGEILKPVKPNANPTYSRELSSAILRKAGHNHANKPPSECCAEENDNTCNSRPGAFKNRRRRSTKDFFTQLSVEEQIIPEAVEITDSNVFVDTTNINIKTPNDEDIMPATCDELEFYTAVTYCTNFACSSLKSLVPPFYGVVNKILDGIDVPHMVLGDLTTGMELPCIADIKMGRTSNYPGRKSDTQAVGKRYLVQESLGFCLAGMNIVNCLTGEQITRFLPATGKKLSVDQVFNALGQLVQRGISVYYGEILTEAILGDLQDILQWFNSQRTYKLRSSSILITYDAQTLLAQDDNSKTSSERKVKVFVKLIDFAHVFLADEEADDNYIFGLNNLITFYTEELQRIKQKTKFKK